MPELSSHGTVSNMRFVFPRNAGARRRPKGCAGGHKPKPVTPPSSRAPRVGSKADMTAQICDVCFTPESGHQVDVGRCPLCAISGHSEIISFRMWHECQDTIPNKICS